MIHTPSYDLCFLWVAFSSLALCPFLPLCLCQDTVCSVSPSHCVFIWSLSQITLSEMRHGTPLV